MLSDKRNIEITQEAQKVQVARCCECKRSFQENYMQKEHCPQTTFRENYASNK